MISKIERVILKKRDNEWFATGIDTPIEFVPIIFLNKNRNSSEGPRPFEQGLLLVSEAGINFYLGTFDLPEDDIKSINLLGGEQILKYGEGKALILFNNDKAGFYNISINSSGEITTSALLELKDNDLNVAVENINVNLIGGTASQTFSAQRDEQGKIEYHIGFKLNEKDLTDRIAMRAKPGANGGEMEFIFDNLPSPINPTPEVSPITKTSIRFGGDNAFEINVNNLSNIIIDKTGAMNIASKLGIDLSGPGISLSDILSTLVDIAVGHVHNTAVGPTTPAMPQDITKWQALKAKIKTLFKGKA